MLHFKSVNDKQNNTIQKNVYIYKSLLQGRTKE